MAPGQGLKKPKEKLFPHIGKGRAHTYGKELGLGYWGASGCVLWTYGSAEK